MTIQTADEFKAIENKIRDYDGALERMYPGQTAFTNEELARIPYPAPTDEERSALEEYLFRTTTPVHYIAYVNENDNTITTWTGQILGHIRRVVGSYRSNFGDRRTVYNIIGINGIVYSATYYQDSGTYCRMKARTKNGNLVHA